MLFLGIWLAASLMLGACWAIVGWLLGRRRDDPLVDAQAVEAKAEEEAA
jgi:hypothetical protein